MGVSRSSIIVLVATCALAACEALGGGGESGGAKVAESGMAKGSAGGFSASMSAELARAGVGEPTITAPPPAAGSDKPSAGSGSAASGSGKDAGSARAGSAQAGSAQAGSAGSAAPMTNVAAGSATPPAAGSATPPAAGSAAASKQPPPAAGSAAGSAVASKEPLPGNVTPAAGGTAKAVGAVQAPATRARVKPSAELAAIKLDLEPNWERDMGTAGTFSLVVKLPGTEDTRLFSVTYGYEEQSAPQDCEAYKKFLEERRMMKVSLSRQRGAACYIEGTDQGGAMAYRYLVTYGGKRLMCHGSLYKDAASSALGDLRDKVLMQGKKICESLAL